MKCLDLFAGIGGFSLAAKMLGWQTVAFVEKEPFCQAVLQKNFPGVPIYDDICKFTAERFRGRIDVLTGGFPCQPFSIAGQRKGTDDERHLFPQMLRVIEECRPRYVVAENVRGLLNISNGRVFADICSQLENLNYEVWPFLIPASSVEAPHERYRVWIVARDITDTDGSADRPDARPTMGAGMFSGTDRVVARDVADTCRERLQGDELVRALGEGTGASRSTPERFGDNHWFEAATRFCGVDDGLPDQLDEREKRRIRQAVEHYGRKETERRLGIDCSKVEERIMRKERIKALGNTIIPMIAFELFKAIEAAEEASL